MVCLYGYLPNRIQCHTLPYGCMYHIYDHVVVETLWKVEIADVALHCQIFCQIHHLPSYLVVWLLVSVNECLWI